MQTTVRSNMGAVRDVGLTFAFLVGGCVSILSLVPVSAGLLFFCLSYFHAGSINGGSSAVWMAVSPLSWFVAAMALAGWHIAICFKGFQNPTSWRIVQFGLQSAAIFFLCPLM